MSVIDIRKTGDEANFITRALKKLGLPATPAEAIAALAKNIRDHRHLETLLSETDPSMRQELYDSVKPHLRFTARPMDFYITSAGQRAEREQWPVLDYQGMLQEFRPAQDVKTIEKAAENALAAEVAKRTLRLVCVKCTRQEAFYGFDRETPLDVILKARMAGWVYDPITRTETCPKCFVPPIETAKN